MSSQNLKNAVRRYMFEHGVNYTTALRRLDPTRPSCSLIAELLGRTGVMDISGPRRSAKYLTCRAIAGELALLGRRVLLPESKTVEVFDPDDWDVVVAGDLWLAPFGPIEDTDALVAAAERGQILLIRVIDGRMAIDLPAENDQWRRVTVEGDTHSLTLAAQLHDRQRAEHNEPGAPRHGLLLGERVRLGQAGNPRTWWDVRASGERYAVCTQQAPFRPRGTLVYCVIDSVRGVRGPVDLVGGGYGDGTFDDTACAQMLAELESGELEVTRRNPAPLEILEIMDRHDRGHLLITGAAGSGKTRLLRQTAASHKGHAVLDLDEYALDASIHLLRASIELPTAAILLLDDVVEKHATARRAGRDAEWTTAVRNALRLGRSRGLLVVATAQQESMVGTFLPLDLFTERVALERGTAERHTAPA